MKTSELHFEYSDRLIALEPSRPPRVMHVRFPLPGLISAESSSNGSLDSWLNPREISYAEVFQLAQAGDLLVLNDTQVVPRRLFTSDNKEILFVRQESPDLWQVLFPSRGMKVGAELFLPGDRVAVLEKQGLPQQVRIKGGDLSLDYFSHFGELALPPYIQRMRGERHNREMDQHRYQTEWGIDPGSTAAPTASLHFSRADLEEWKKRGLRVAKATLHVGLGTFLPVKTEDLKGHVMHREWCRVPQETADLIEQTKKSGGRVFALGTTVTRTLESWAQGRLVKAGDSWMGETDLFILPGFEFQVVDVLMTNFHQPESTLLALVCAFAGRERVLQAYQWAVDREFRLFSYGDLTIWERSLANLRS